MNTTPIGQTIGRGKVLPYSLPSVGPGVDPGVQAVSPQVTWSHPSGGGCHYFSPGLRLPSQPKSVTAHRPVSNYTAWWQRHVRVSSLPKAVTWKRTVRDSNPRPLGSRTNALPLSHTGHQDRLYRYANGEKLPYAVSVVGRHIHKQW